MNEPSNNPAPQVPQPTINVQSLKPTGMSGAVPVIPSARGASGSVPLPGVPLPMPASVAPMVPHLVEVGMAEAAPVIGPPPKRNMLVEYWRKVGGGSLMVSLLVHAGLIALFIMIAIVIPSTEKPADFLPGGGSKAGQEASQELAHQVQQKKRTVMNKTTPMKKVVSNSANAAILLPEVPIDAVDVPEMAIPTGGSMGSGGFGSAGAGGGFGNGVGRGGMSGFTSLPPTMKSRCNAVERLQKLKESGGSPECEKAVSKALEWFKTKQQPDGSWGSQYKGAMTGMALLAYFGRCETPDSPFYGDTVMKGIFYLVELSKKHDGMMATSKGIGAVYEHGIACYALGEMYTLARLGNKSLPGMREAFEKGCEIIVKKQLPTGGWGYNADGTYRDNGASDPSVTGWHYQALKAAKLGSAKVTNLHQSIDRCTKYLASIQTKDGGFGGPNREAGAYTQWTMTGVGVLGLQTLGHGKSAEIKKGIKWSYDFFQKEKPTWADVNLYSWYYFAQIFFQDGGVAWKFWNDTALPEILTHQEKNGSWRSPTNVHGAQAEGNDLYPTALCTLMLEVYYRYLKVGDRDEGSIFDRKGK